MLAQSSFPSPFSSLIHRSAFHRTCCVNSPSKTQQISRISAVQPGQTRPGSDDGSGDTALISKNLNQKSWWGSNCNARPRESLLSLSAGAFVGYAARGDEDNILSFVHGLFTARKRVDFGRFRP
jgi:hypothetical protein